MRGRDGEVVDREHDEAGERTSPFDCPLRPDATFARFVVGESNQHAYRLARRIAAASAGSRASLDLHGGVGVGKTHLAMAIAHAVRARHGADAVLVVSAERIASAWRGGDDERRELDAALGGAPLLIVDDVQFLADAGSSREDLARRIARLRATAQRLVLTCDLPRDETAALGLPLEGGTSPAYSAEIAPPEAALRREILIRKAARLGSELATDVAAFIGEIAPASVRALEGALHRALEFAAVLRVPLSVSVAARALEAWQRTTPPPTLDAIAGAAAAALAVPPRHIRQAARRDRRTVLARQVAIYLARRLSGRPLAEIAADYGCRDHSAAAHAFASVKKRIASEAELRDTVARLERELSGERGGASRPVQRARG
jgi:chromosomal replication initiator protein